jgi:hypothetical protein
LKFRTRHTSAKSSDLLAVRLDEVLQDVVDRGGIPDLSSLAITYTPNRIEGEQGYINAYIIYKVEE